MTEYEAYELIQKVCNEIMHAEDWKDMAKDRCSLIDEYDPTLNTCNELNCPVLKDIKKYLEKGKAKNVR